MVCDTALVAVGHTTMVRLHRMLLPGPALASLVALCAVALSVAAVLGDPPAGTHPDTEPAMLGRLRTNGEFSHAAPGDGLTTLDEYRGFFFDGPNTGHTRLSFAAKELLVQVEVIPGIEGTSIVNPNFTLSEINLKEDILNPVCAFFADPERGLGFRMYWVFTPFSFDGPPLQSLDGLLSVEHAYRYHGEIYNSSCHNVLPFIGDGFVMRDVRFKGKMLEGISYDNIFTHNTLLFAHKFFPSQRHPSLEKFVKLALIDRLLEIVPNKIQNQIIYNTRVVNENAFSEFSSTVNYRESGAVVAMVSIAEEGPATSLNRHYTKAEFINRLQWAIAHELMHLLVREQNDENWAGNHLKNNSEALMGHNFPYNHGLSHVQGAQAEIEKINFRTRASVAPEGGQE
ncbi:MAG: hypothetical protein IJU44_01890 [Kiritimatiellae bacterium]|nr:hypothetical protein [Kiritimatiellia bacterium]